MTPTLLKNLNIALQTIQQKKVFEINAGKGTGSIFTMYFSDPENTYDRNTSDMMMVFCAWKILFKYKYICTWKDSEIKIKHSLNKLLGKTIINITANEAYDIIIHLSDNYHLYINCDSSADNDIAFDSDYFIKIKNRTTSVLRGRVLLE